MARTQARILTSIWNDEDFLALDGSPQRLYMFLLSQPNLSHAGLLPLTVKRWANRANDVTVQSIEADIEALERAAFVVVDEATEELLIRSLVRNDGIWKQPKMMLAMRSDAGEIMSPRLQAALRSELARIDTTEIPKPEVREHIEDVIASMIGGPTDTPGEAQPIPLDTPTRNPHAGGHALASASTTTSVTTSTTGDWPASDPTAELLIEHANAYTAPLPPSALTTVRTAIMRLVADGVPAEQIRAGLTRMREKSLSAGLLPQLVAETIPTTDRRTRPSTTDAAVAQGLALVDRYSTQEIAQ